MSEMLTFICLIGTWHHMCWMHIWLHMWPRRLCMSSKHIALSP